MDEVILIFTLLAGAIIGFVVTRIIYQHQIKSSGEIKKLNVRLENYNIENRIQKEQLSIKMHEMESLKTDLKENLVKIMELTGSLSSKESDNKNLQEKLAEQKKDINGIREKFVYEFKALANEILSRERMVFTEQNKTNLDAVLLPLAERIKGFEKKVDEVYNLESKERFSLKEEVKRLSDLNQQISRDAQNLVSALKGQSKTQGDWGELILENILEKSGLVKGREFITQKSYKAEDGKRLQPDVVLTLPGKKNVVIDAKVSLTAYEIYASATGDEIQKTAVKNHLISVKKHIDELAAKNYQMIYQINSPGFVIMFMPVEPAFLIAIKSDPELWNYAYQKGVLLVGPTNLVATLKMVASLWQQEYQNKNAMEIAAESGKLYDKFVGFVKDMEDIGDKINSTQISYDKAVNKLSTGRGNLISKANKLKKLGAKTSGELPESLLEKDKERMRQGDKATMR